MPMEDLLTILLSARFSPIKAALMIYVTFITTILLLNCSKIQLRIQKLVLPIGLAVAAYQIAIIVNLKEKRDK